MASSNFSDLNINLASDDTPPPDSQPHAHITSLNSLFDSSVVSEDPIPTPISPENVDPSDKQNAPLGEMDVHTPQPISQQPPFESQDLTDPQTGSSSKRGGRKRGGGGGSTPVAGVFLEPEQFPDWVPKDWRVMKRPRPDGSSIDTYYYDPLTNRQLRSKREVLEFLANGTCTRSQKRVNNMEGATKTLLLKNSQPIDFNSAATPEKQLKSPQSINTEGIPEKVTWVLGNSAGWTPFIGEEMVPEHIRLEWQAKFNPLVPKSGGCRA